jgi:hypothetical protein
MTWYCLGEPFLVQRQYQLHISVINSFIFETMPGSQTCGVLKIRVATHTELCGFVAPPVPPVIVALEERDLMEMTLHRAYVDGLG